MSTSRTLTLFGYLDPRNVNKASILAIREFGEHISNDGIILLHEFIVNRNNVQRNPDSSAVV